MKNEFDLTEWNKLLVGEPHRTDDPYLVYLREKCRGLLTEYNATLRADDSRRREILAELLGTESREDLVIQPPFFCDYGVNLHIGRNFMANFDCVILDCAPVYIGDHVLLGPKVQIYPVFHPTDPVHRRDPVDISKPIRIGDDAWIGGGSILLPGVSVGDRSIVGAGSVVTRDVPADCIAAGNPCRVIRRLDPEQYGKDLFV